MDISLPSALGVIGFVFFVAGALLLLSWLQHRELAPLALWGMAFGSAAAGTALIAARGQVADFWSIVVANILIAAGYGTMWSGARLFCGRRPVVAAALAGVAAWMLALLTPGFFADSKARVSLAVAVNIAYTLATAAELWQWRGDALPSRWPAIALLLAHALALPSRLPLISNYFGISRYDTNLLIFVTFESMLLAMAGAYLFGSLVRERLAKAFQREAMADPLTGVANRRAFIQQGTRLLQRAGVERRAVSLLLFDIDHFKGINDLHGHAAGDAVLSDFCEVAKAQLRPSDLFARIGGEEFVSLLVDVDAGQGTGIAERVRTAFEGAVYGSDGQMFGATVSVGVACAEARDADLSALLIAADRALYRAKQRGRNQVAEEANISPAERVEAAFRRG